MGATMILFLRVTSRILIGVKRVGLFFEVGFRAPGLISCAGLKYEMPGVDGSSLAFGILAMEYVGSVAAIRTWDCRYKISYIVN